EKLPWTQNKRPVAAAVAMVAVVLMVVVMGGIMIKYTLTEAWHRRAHLRLEDIIADEFTPVPFNGTWVSESDIMFRDKGNNAILLNLYSRSTKLLTSNFHVIPTLSGDVEYSMSHSKHFLLAMHNRTKLPGQLAVAQYEIINIRNQTNQSLRYENYPNEDRHLLQFAMWNSRRSEIIMAYHNDLYYVPNPALNIQIQLTHSGQPNVIFHGVTDYLYREAILKTDVAIWLSPNGQRLAYGSFNNTHVQATYITYYGKPGSLHYQYPHNLQIRYPKAGTPLPTVTLSVLDLEYKLQKRLSTLYAPLPRGMSQGDVLLTAVAWMNNDEIASVWMDRLQTRAVVTVFNYDKGSRYDLLRVNEEAGWLPLLAAPFFSSEDQRMVLILPQDQGDREGKFPHVCLVQQNQGNALIKPLTMGKYSVKKILAWDKQHNKIYFLATEIDSPSIQHLYSVSDDQWRAPNTPACITCHIRTSEIGMPCQYNSASFNDDNSFYMLNCEGPGVPEISIFDRSHMRVIVWEKNAKIRTALQKVGHLPTKQYLQIEIADGVKAHVELRIPPDYNPKKNKKYPLLVYLSGSPETCPITEKFSVQWNDYITGSKNVVLARISARGSGLRGSTLSKIIYRQLGSVEINDIIYVTRNLQDLFTFIDKSRTAIWGKHFGGYLTTMTLLKDVEHTFQCGLAVSPITDWLYYDAVRSERYMRLPTIQDNLAGYIDASLTNKVENLRYKKFMLIHGTADSSVHYQHSMMLAKALEQNGILFSQSSYPDEEMNLKGVTSHLYFTMEKFFDDCFSSST
ncbi:Venom dipeptidyl peptidase 4, partial [Gryllus bimaculatus]